MPVIVLDEMGCVTPVIGSVIVADMRVVMRRVENADVEVSASARMSA
jgi:hypothetical protein